MSFYYKVSTFTVNLFLSRRFYFVIYSGSTGSLRLFFCNQALSRPEFLLQPYYKDFSAARNICKIKLLVNLAKISCTRIEVGLQYKQPGIFFGKIFYFCRNSEQHVKNFREKRWGHWQIACSRNTQYEFIDNFCLFQTDKYDQQSLSFTGERTTWYRPTCLKELVELKHSYPDARLVIGNTEVGQ